MKEQFLKDLGNLRFLLDNRPKPIVPKDRRHKEYLDSRSDYYLKSLEAAAIKVKQGGFALGSLYADFASNEKAIAQIIAILAGRDLASKINDLEFLARSLRQKRRPSSGIKLSAPKNIPQEIRQEIISDLSELERCFNSGCFRASTILCGRILETCLHRKFYDATGQDILEKNPGIGLGKLIAKLDEKEVKFDPGLKQQIHLINQVRVFSVHKKQEAFSPSHSQTLAMILYTTDVLGRMFED